MSLKYALSPLVLLASSIAWSDVYVVVGVNNSIDSLTKKEIVAIYTGKTKAFPNGQFAKPVDLPDDSKTKQVFYKQLTNRSINQINSYWARLVFTGRYVPPQQLPTESAIHQHLSETPGAIAYVKQPNTELVKVVYVVKTP